MSSMRPLGDRIIVRRVINPDLLTPGGLVVPDTAREKPQEGDVISVGLKVHDIKPGERVLFGKYTGTEVKLDGQDYLIMREDDVLGVIELGKAVKV